MATIHDFDEIETVPTPSGRMTEDEFEAWCRGFEKVRAEWVDGEVIVMSPVNTEHADIGGFLVVILREFIEHHDLGRVYGPEHTTRFRSGSRLLRLVPDIYFVTAGRLNLLQRTYLDGPPDLAIEIVSPDSKVRDRREKFRDYEAAGVREYWIIDPLTRTIEASRLQDGVYQRIGESDGRFASEVLSGFFLRPNWLWQEPLPKVRGILRELGIGA